MTLLTRLALSAFVLSLATVAIVPSASATCVGTATTPTGATLCVFHPVNPYSTCEVAVYTSVNGIHRDPVVCSIYRDPSTGTDCFGYVDLDPGSAGLICT